MRKDRMMNGFRRLAEQEHMDQLGDARFFELLFDPKLLTAIHEVNVVEEKETLVALLDHIEKIVELMNQSHIEKPLGDMSRHDIELGGTLVLDHLAVPVKA